MMPETSKPLADADGPEEFEKLYKERQKSPQPESEPQPEAEADLEVEVEAPETSEPSETPESETEPVSETGEPQEPKKRERSFQGRISELTGKVKAEKDRNDLLEQELRELRTRKPAIEQPTVFGIQETIQAFVVNVQPGNNRIKRRDGRFLAAGKAFPQRFEFRIAVLPFTQFRA